MDNTNEMESKIEATKKLQLSKSAEILKCLEGVSYLNCQTILTSVKAELNNVAFVKTDN